MRKVTEDDLRKDEFKGKDPADYEFRTDGAVVRKDRWERGIRDIAATLDMDSRSGFEIDDVVRLVKILANKYKGETDDSHSIKR